VPKNILLVDDHLLFAESVKFLLETRAEIEVQAFVSLPQALAYVGGDAPIDLALIDYAMPEGAGFDALERISALRPGLPVAFLTGLDDPNLAMEALHRGAAGWLSKAMPGEALINAVKLLRSGERFVPAELLLQQRTSALTTRERDVAALLAQGLSDKEIADQLAVQVGTVKVHVKSLLRKFGVANRTQFALRYRGA